MGDDVLSIKPNLITYNEHRGGHTSYVSNLLLSKLSAMYLDSKVLINFSKVSNKIVYGLNSSRRAGRLLLNGVKLSAWVVSIVRKEKRHAVGQNACAEASQDV